MKRELMGLIVKREDGSEIVNYDNPAFPSYIYDGWIAPKVTWERVPHFHEDIEILTVKEGKMAYCVNGKVYELYEGDTIVVNANQIHYSICVDDTLAKYVIFVVHPSILTASVVVELQAIRPFLDDPDLPCLRFRRINEFSKEMYDLVVQLPDVRNDAFEITKRFYLIWDLILKKSRAIGAAVEDASADPHMQSFKVMMAYIAGAYRESVTLEKIAASAHVSKSLCNHLFHQYVGESPISYVMHLRARKVAEYLRSGSAPLSEIADLTGFSGVSYLSETFRKFFGCSPREYRKQWAAIAREE